MPSSFSMAATTSGRTWPNISSTAKLRMVEHLLRSFPSVKWIFPTAKLRYSARRDAEFSSSSFWDALKGQEIITQWLDLKALMRLNSYLSNTVVTSGEHCLLSIGRACSDDLEAPVTTTRWVDCADFSRDLCNLALVLRVRADYNSENLVSGV